MRVVQKPPRSAAAEGALHADPALAAGLPEPVPANGAGVRGAGSQRLDGHRQRGFFSEPYDCAILLGNGHFGANTAAAKLFDEWLIPICAPALLADGQRDLAACPLIHPSPDRRDWRRWLQSGIAAPIDLTRGQVFDSLEQGNTAAIAGHGVSIGDLALSLRTIEEGLLALPCDAAVRTGDGYYLVWPEESAKRPLIERLQAFLTAQTPDVSRAAVRFIE